MSNTLSLTNVPGIGPSMAKVLISRKIDSVKKLAKIDLDKLVSVQGIGEISGGNMIQAAKDLVATDKPEKDDKKDKKGKKNKKDKKDKKKDGKNKKNKKGKNKKDKKKGK